jgi:hypothetical protein
MGLSTRASREVNENMVQTSLERAEDYLYFPVSRRKYIFRPTSNQFTVNVF